MGRRVVTWMTVLTLALLAWSAPAQAAGVHKFRVFNYRYEPMVGSTTVARGDVVVWTNYDRVRHSVTATTGEFDSGLFWTYESFVLDTSSLVPGTYTYYCLINHAPHTNMRGTLTVV